MERYSALVDTPSYLSSQEIDTCTVDPEYIFLAWIHVAVIVMKRCGEVFHTVG